jgi:PPP family 3-phenylpropionic acid transporter
MRPTLALSAYWFLYFAGLGVFFPFYTLYLREDAGLSGTEVGLVMATLPLVGMVAQPAWGHLADRSGQRSAILVLLTIASAGAYLLLGTLHGFASIVAGTAALALAATAVVPLSISVTFAALPGRGTHAFGYVRVWGTVGYLLAVGAFPWLLRRFSPDGGLGGMFAATAACTLTAALVWPWLPRRGDAALRAARGEWRLLLHDPPLRRLLLFSFGGYLFLQGPMSLFPLFIRDRGGDVATVGQMWVVMLLLEIPLVAFAGAGLRRLGARGLLGLGVIAGGVRWLVCAFSTDLAILYPVQLLHGITVAGLLIGGPLYLEMIVPERLRSTGQGLLATVGLALGNILSNTASGWLIDAYGVDAPYLIGGVGALALGAAVTWILPDVTFTRPAPSAVQGSPKC